MSHSQLQSVELFAGAGGLALGISQNGFETVSLVEYDKETCITLRKNKELGNRPMNSWPIVECDVRHINYSEYPSGIDLLSGGPPCQPFSLGGKAHGYNDSRDMFPEAVRAVRELKPRAFIFENVKGLLRQSFATYFKYIELQLSYPAVMRLEDEQWTEHLSRLEKMFTSHEPVQYRVVTRLLNAADYGVPQKRERIIFVGFREDLGLEWSFPKPTHSQAKLAHSKWITGQYWENHEIPLSERPSLNAEVKYSVQEVLERIDSDHLLPWLTVRDAISDLPEPLPGKEPTIPNHRYNPGAKVYPGHTGSNIDEPSKTIKAGGHGVPGGENMLAYSDGRVRYFTVRESARIQTFPDNYIFPVSWTESMRQLGNAVPVKLGDAVVGSVKRLLQSKI